jgi:hypothetical protein
MTGPVALSFSGVLQPDLLGQTSVEAALVTA